MPEKRIFVSDLHMADRSGVDDFISPALFVRFLELLLYFSMIRTAISPAMGPPP